MLFSEPKIPQIRSYPDVYKSTDVSVLFSEPKIPQIVRSIRQNDRFVKVSVLFSEPKIPQIWRRRWTENLDKKSFSALQRAENSSN